MGSPRKQRNPQGIYAFPAEVRKAVDAMLSENLSYKEIARRIGEKFNLKTSPAALSGYFGRRLRKGEGDPKNHGNQEAPGGTVLISITVPSGCPIQLTVTEGSASIKRA